MLSFNKTQTRRIGGGYRHKDSSSNTIFHPVNKDIRRYTSRASGASSTIDPPAQGDDSPPDKMSVPRPVIVEQSQQEQPSSMSEEFLSLFSSRMNPQRLQQILDDQTNIQSGVRYTADFPSKSYPYEEDHTNETIFGMDLHSLRKGELVNDAIISAFTKIAFANSPYWDRRRFVPPYLSKQVELQPEKYGKRDAVIGSSSGGRAESSAAAPWLPTDESDIILVPYNRSLHWTLAVLVSTGDRGQLRLHQNSLDSDFGHSDALLEILRRCELISREATLERFPGPRQKDGYNCGVAVCLAMYAWLMHPNPLEFDWETLRTTSPEVLDEFRKFVLYVVSTGDIFNIFEGETSSGTPVGQMSESVPGEEQIRDDTDDTRMDIDGEEGMETVSITSESDMDDDYDMFRRPVPVGIGPTETQIREVPDLYHRFDSVAPTRTRDIHVLGDSPFESFFRGRHTTRREDPFDAFNDPFDMFFTRQRREERGIYPLIL